MAVDLYTGFNEALQSNKSNKCLLKKYFKPETIIPALDQATPTFESNFGTISFTGFAEPHVSVEIGLNASDPEAYTTFAPVFNPVIKDYHKINQKQKIHHPSSYFGGVTDLACSNLDPDEQNTAAVRVSIRRNLSGYRFSNTLSPEDRIELEEKSKEALCSLSGELKGAYHPIDSISQELKDELAKDHLLFDNTNKLLSINGVFRDWPNSRGMFVSENKKFVAWINGEDHLQLMTAQRGANIEDVYKQMVYAIQMLERKLSFAKDDHLGYLTYCPSNVGTGLHATAHINLPHLSTKKNFGDVCEKLNLKTKSLETILMEGISPMYAISNKRTVGLTEIEAVAEMVSGVQELIRLDKKAAEGRDSTRKCSIS